MLGGRAHPGFRLSELPRCIDQGVDLRSSARPDSRVAVNFQRRGRYCRIADGGKIALSLPITARGRSPAMPETSLVVVDPGHFHATLVQQRMYPELSPVVRVYAPLGADLIDYLSRIARYNRRPQAATDWRLDVHAGPDFSIGYGMSRRAGSPSSRAATAARSIGSSPRSKPACTCLLTSPRLSCPRICRGWRRLLRWRTNSSSC